METKVNYTVVGLFVIVLGAALVGAVLWLAAGLQGKVYDRYVVYTSESVSGLNPEGAVKYKGVEVGQVAVMEIDPDNPNQVKLTLEVERGTPIREDTRAVLAIQGITGLVYVELTGGSRTAAPLPAAQGDSLPEIRSGPSLVARLDQTFSSLATEFGGLSARLDTLLSDQNLTALSGTLTNLNTITGAVAGRADSFGAALDSAALTLQDSVRISTELSALLTRVGGSIAAVEKTAQSITKASEGINAAVKESREDLQSLTKNTVPEVSSLLGELRQLTDVIQRFGREIESNPRALLFGRQNREPGPGETQEEAR